MNLVDFENKIRQWIQLDNKLIELDEQTKHLREQKNELERCITTYASSNNLSNFILVHGIPGGRLKLTTKRIAEPLTFNYLETVLGDIIKNENELRTILHHIHKKRETKMVSEIRRIFVK